MANGRGGVREGAGRKPKALHYAQLAGEVEEQIAAALPDIIGGLIEAAKGGDLGAARYLCDRILGRVASVELPPAEDRRPPYTSEDAERDLRSKARLDSLGDLICA